MQRGHPPVAGVLPAAFGTRSSACHAYAGRQQVQTRLAVPTAVEHSHVAVWRLLGDDKAAAGGHKMGRAIHFDGELPPWPRQRIDCSAAIPDHRRRLQTNNGLSGPCYNGLPYTAATLPHNKVWRPASCQRCRQACAGRLMATLQTIQTS
jgi:hypothetical protein